MSAHKIRRAAKNVSQLGAIVSPEPGLRLGVVLEYSCWGADNGCYSQGCSFSLSRYLAWLDAMSPAKASCLFATAPDVVGDAQATWERSRDVLPRLKALGYKPALVAQDGLENMQIEWDAFEVLFVGGTTEWKLSEVAYSLVAEAKRRGKWAHMGRCNSWRRLLQAAIAGYDSADGTKIAFGPDKNLEIVLGWLQELERQPVMTMEATA